MDLTAQDREKLKNIQMELLKDFIAVCEKLGLRYYAIGGTALGVVRHGGYIPWDDDIDVAMMREDYEIFLKEGQSHLKDGYFLQTFDTDGFPGNYAKIRDENTTFVETSVEHLPISHGVYIDIFPLDYYPTEDVEAHTAKKQKLAVDLACMVGFHGVPFKRKVRMLLGKISLAFKPSLNSTKKIILAREALFKGVPPTDVVVNNSGDWVAMPIEAFGEGVKMSFDGLEINMPKDYDTYLSRLHGDYMPPPPEDKRVPHHYATDFCAEESYKTRWKR